MASSSWSWPALLALWERLLKDTSDETKGIAKEAAEAGRRAARLATEVSQRVSQHDAARSKDAAESAREEGRSAQWCAKLASNGCAGWPGPAPRWHQMGRALTEAQPLPPSWQRMGRALTYGQPLPPRPIVQLLEGTGPPPYLYGEALANVQPLPPRLDEHTKAQPSPPRPKMPPLQECPEVPLLEQQIIIWTPSSTNVSSFSDFPSLHWAMGVLHKM